MKTRYKSPLFLMITIIALVFLSEFLIMVVFPLFFALPSPIDALLDPLLLIVFLSPLLYLLLFRPMTGKIGQLMEMERSLRDSEMKLQHTFRQIPAILWTINKDLQFTSSMGNRYGVLDVEHEEVLGKTLSEYFQVDDPQFYPIKMHGHALKGESARYDFEWSGHFFDTSVAPLHDEGGDIIGAIGIALDVTERKRAEVALKESEARLRDLAARMAKVAEEERKSLARELHDRVGQNLTALNINLNMIKEQLSAESTTNLETKLSDSMRLVEETAVRIRDVMAELRPEVLDDYGLLAALKWYGERFSKRTGLAVEVAGEQSSQWLTRDTEMILFRIAQEAMVNVIKHAGADEVSLSLAIRAGTARLTIADNGVGFDPAASPRLEERRGLGLISMRERAYSIGAHFRVESSVGKGTKVIVEVPGR